MIISPYIVPGLKRTDEPKPDNKFRVNMLKLKDKFIMMGRVYTVTKISRGKLTAISIGQFRANSKGFELSAGSMQIIDRYVESE